MPLVPNRAQLRLYALMAAQRAAGLPVRIIVLKSRRQGISTGFEAYCFADVFNRPTRRAFVAAHDAAASSVLFQMNKRFAQNLPKHEQKEMERSNRAELLWKHPHSSSFLVQTAGNLNLGRGDLIHDFHGSEIAFWPNAEETLLSVQQCIPPLPETAVVLESTANGVGGVFHERWKAAVQRMLESDGSLDGFVPIFFSWLEDPDNRKKIPPGYEFGALDDDERRLRKHHGASDEHLFWRRWKIAEECLGDVEKFKQEYPSTTEEAFRHSGRPAIPRVIIRYHESTVSEPRKVRLVWDPTAVRGVRAEYGDFQRDCWLVWREPQPEHDYTLGGDLYEGQLTAKSSRRTESDMNAAVVLDRRETEIVAGRNDRLAPDLFGEEMLKCSWWYNEAWASPEVNSSGGLSALRPFVQHGYGRIYQREQPLDYIDPAEAARLGWKTTGSANGGGTRGQMIDDYIAACRPSWQLTEGAGTPDFEGKLLVHWLALVEQEITFEVSKHGKREHRDGCMDDILFAAFIAWQLHLRVPRGLAASRPTMVTVHKTLSDLNRPGAVDWGPKEEMASRQLVMG